MMPLGTGERQKRVAVSDALKRRELLEDFMHWYFDSFVLTLIKVSPGFVTTFKELNCF